MVAQGASARAVSLLLRARCSCSSRAWTFGRIGTSSRPFSHGSNQTRVLSWTPASHSSFSSTSTPTSTQEEPLPETPVDTGNEQAGLDAATDASAADPVESTAEAGETETPPHKEDANGASQAEPSDGSAPWEAPGYHSGVGLRGQFSYMLADYMTNQALSRAGISIAALHYGCSQAVRTIAKALKDKDDDLLAELCTPQALKALERRYSNDFSKIVIPQANSGLFAMGDDAEQTLQSVLLQEPKRDDPATVGVVQTVALVQEGQPRSLAEFLEQANSKQGGMDDAARSLQSLMVPSVTFSPGGLPRMFPAQFTFIAKGFDLGQASAGESGSTGEFSFVLDDVRLPFADTQRMMMSKGSE